MPVSFFDTNVLVYLASGDTAKADQAEAAIAKGGSISVQILNELTNVARRKMKMSWDESHGLLNTLRSLLAVHPLTVETHDTMHLGWPSGSVCRTCDAMIAASSDSRRMRHAVVGGRTSTA